MSGWSSSGWPSPDRADDERLARSLAAGQDTEALIQLLDRYAARLFDYCHALLRDEDSAAGALEDSLLAAYVHVGRLREPDRFRSWLYTLVRNECLRRLRDPHRPAERREAPEVEDMFAGAEERARRLETRLLVHNALAGLRGRERETLDLMLRHGLDSTEIAGVLGTDPQTATGLAGEARRRLDGTLAAVVIARTGRADCPHVAQFADDGDAPPPPATVRRLLHHIETCGTCTERRHRTVSTAGLLQTLLVALMPDDLRGRVIAFASDPAYGAELEDAARRAEPFDTWGWPMPVDRHGSGGAGAGRRTGTPRLWPAVAAAAIVMLLAVGGFVALSGSEDRTSAQGPRDTAAAPAPSSSPTEAADPSESPAPTPTVTTPTPSRSTTPTPTPSRTRSSPASSPSRSTRPARGRLSVGSCTIGPLATSCTLPIGAVGGPVSWTAGASGGLTVAPRSGRLAAGGSGGVTVTRPQTCGTGGSGSVGFSPNGATSVSWSCPDDDGDGGSEAGGGTG